MHNLFFLFVLLSPVFLSGQNLSDNIPSDSSTIELVFTGDVMLAGSGMTVFQKKGVDYAFDSTRSILQDADITCINLEAPFTSRGVPFDKKYNFRMRPNYVSALVSAGIDVCNLANNHILDYGEQGLFDTFDILDSNDIDYCGAGSNIKDAMRGVIVTRKGIRVGFLSFSLTYPEEFWATQTKPGTLYPTEDILQQCIQSLLEDTDYIAVSFHWGGELMTIPKPYQKRFAKKSIDWGADVVIGHHPHVPQGIEIYQGKLIAYSLGNFVFGSYSNKVNDGLLVRVVLGPDNFLKAEVIPIAINNNDVHLQPKILKGTGKARSIENINQISKVLNNNRQVVDLNGFILLN